MKEGVLVCNGSAYTWNLGDSRARTPMINITPPTAIRAIRRTPILLRKACFS
jgi:hypothetical protein